MKGVRRYTKKRAIPFLIFCTVLFLVAAYIISGRGYYRGMGRWALSPSLLLDLKQLAGLQNFYSQVGQDKWILGKVYPGVKNGYFVDIGSWDAEVDSNSKALEEVGWTGICIDPFPRNWKNRKCQLFKEVVYSKDGEVVKFRTAGIFGGIDTHIHTWKKGVESFPVIELTTTTIGSILNRANAPRFIHYVSIDTEGSELEILKAFPFSEYTVGAFTIEHNFEEPKRQQIRELLKRNGYRFVREQIVDDFYVLADKQRLVELQQMGADVR
ncbi:MAG TPA: FkbM family methyltransferase [Candidatus Acidoferrales bacterium]|nr:FkbM family methyltransferase [Candidatus Acidoferrales bacterium]